MIPRKISPRTIWTASKFAPVPIAQVPSNSVQGNPGRVSQFSRGRSAYLLQFQLLKFKRIQLEIQQKFCQLGMSEEANDGFDLLRDAILYHGSDGIHYKRRILSSRECRRRGSVLYK